MEEEAKQPDNSFQLNAARDERKIDSTRTCGGQWSGSADSVRRRRRDGIDEQKEFSFLNHNPTFHVKTHSGRTHAESRCHNKAAYSRQ